MHYDMPKVHANMRKSMTELKSGDSTKLTTLVNPGRLYLADEKLCLPPAAVKGTHQGHDHYGADRFGESKFTGSYITQQSPVLLAAFLRQQRRKIIWHKCVFAFRIGAFTIMSMRMIGGL